MPKPVKLVEKTSILLILPPLAVNEGGFFCLIIILIKVLNKSATVSRNHSYFQTNTLALQFVITLKVIAVSLFIQHTTTNSNLSIAANVVIGTNICSDIGASYIDFFGGRSTSYEKKVK